MKLTMKMKATMTRMLPTMKLALGALALAALAGCGQGAAGGAGGQASDPAPAPSVPHDAAYVQLVEDPLDVPYVPTPDTVVAKMLEVARVNKDDLLYDLGSGDGRIVVTAASRYGARGVGYDLNPKRIAESNENARAAGVTNLVRFEQQDLFEADLTGATVVTLYLLPDVNMTLRPRLLKELKPGTRVVSHNYGMGDWEPASVDELEVNGVTHYVYYWVVPPDGKINTK